jgi:hypothetical protein
MAVYEMGYDAESHPIKTGGFIHTAVKIPKLENTTKFSSQTWPV